MFKKIVSLLALFCIALSCSAAQTVKLISSDNYVLGFSNIETFPKQKEYIDQQNNIITININGTKGNTSALWNNFNNATASHYTSTYNVGGNTGKLNFYFKGTLTVGGHPINDIYIGQQEHIWFIGKATGTVQNEGIVVTDDHHHEYCITGEYTNLFYIKSGKC